MSQAGEVPPPPVAAAEGPATAATAAHNLHDAKESALGGAQRVEVCQGTACLSSVYVDGLESLTAVLG